MEWIKCSERKPTTPDQVLVCIYFGDKPWVEAASYQGFGGLLDSWSTTQHGNLTSGNKPMPHAGLVTHWMPLPQAPQS